MAKESFAAALAAVLVHEGGYSNHPDDPGGPTMKGIIQRVYDGYRRARGLAVRPVRQIEEREIREIYRHQYWDAVRADELPPGIDYVVFDGAVNSGPAQSAKWLQRALGLPADGQVGAVTLAAAAKAPRAVLVDDICDRRLAMLQNLRTWPVFGRGWGRRVADVRRLGKAWRPGAAGDADGTADVVAAGGDAKAPVSSANPLPRPRTGAGVVAGGAAASAVAEAARQIEPLAGTSSYLATAFTVLTIAGLALTIGGLAYVWWSATAQERQADVLDLLPPAAAPEAEDPA